VEQGFWGGFRYYSGQKGTTRAGKEHDRGGGGGEGGKSMTMGQKSMMRAPNRNTDQEPVQHVKKSGTGERRCLLAIEWMGLVGSHECIVQSMHPLTLTKTMLC